MIDYLTPKEIVERLDRYIIGQEAAKRAVAIALRNRARRRELDDDLRDEVIPKNILMIGPTGVGKTEIARRLANLADAPFIKVEATKFTEVGYVGRDVESIIRDLVDTAYRMEQQRAFEEVQEEAERRANERLVDILAGIEGGRPAAPPFSHIFGAEQPPSTPEQMESERQRREQMARQEERVRQFTRQRLEAGELEDEEVEIEVEESSLQSMQIFTAAGMEEMGMDMQNILGNIFPARKTTKRTTVAEARRVLTYQEAEKLIDDQEVARRALEAAEQDGIVFLDELDKVTGGKGEGRYGPDVSREGVQRDILPIIEGCTVTTKYGPVNTDHILFICAGAFHISKPSDLIPELQGRIPLRVELHSLTQADFERILVEPDNSLVKQYVALMATEGIKLEFTDEAIAEIARLAQQVNEQTENIGARRLYTMMERLLDELSFTAPEITGQHIVIDADYVRKQLADVVEDRDLSRYML